MVICHCHAVNDRTIRGAVAAGAIDAEHMRRMNLAVDRDGRSPAEVAREFLRSLAR